MHILLAEDDPIIADGLLRTLRKTGHAVDHVANGRDADAALLSQPFDLLILDLGGASSTITGAILRVAAS